MGNSLGQLSATALQAIDNKIQGDRVALEMRPEWRELYFLPATDLRERILSGQLTLPQVVELFHLRRQAEKNEHRLVTDVFFREPMDRARVLQESLKTVPPEELPLLGFILSIKDSILMKGTRSTGGLAVNYPYIYTKDTPLLDYLQAKGALITARSNVPQLLYAMESGNNVFGEALNPINLQRTPGGSSGGEAGQVAMGLTNTGVGSDGAGSLRIPALFCGLCTLKTTVSRFDQSLLNNFMETNPDIADLKDFPLGNVVTIGPISRSVRDLETFFHVYNDFNRIKRSLPPIPWRKPDHGRRVGLLAPFAFFEVSAANLRAFQMARQALAVAGYEFVDIDFAPFIVELTQVCISMIMKNSLAMDMVMRKHHMPEPIIEPYKEMAMALKTPSMILRQLRSFYPPRKQIMMDAILQSRNVNYSVLWRRLDEFKRQVQNVFEANQLDFILCHGMPPAVPIGISGDLSLAAAYTMIWNYLDFPAGALSVTTVQPDEEAYVSAHNDKITQVMQTVMRGATGLPVGVQLIGLPFFEENVLDAMKVIEAGVKFDHAALHRDLL